MKKIIIKLICYSFLISNISQAMTFKKSCETGDEILVSAVGDILPHTHIQKAAIKNRSYMKIWEEVIPWIEMADIAYGNLETAVAPGVDKRGRQHRDPGLIYDDKIYSAYPHFNAPTLLVEDLVESGFDIVSTANNHAYDRGSIGVDRTIDTLRESNLKFFGTRKKNDNKNSSWFKVTHAKGISITWIACTYGSSAARKNPDNQILNCYSKHGKKTISNIIKNQKNITDAIIITPHWGLEYSTKPAHNEQKKLGRKWLDLGASAVIGSHPHILQPMEKYTTKDNREGFIFYSLGNFISNQGWNAANGARKRASVVAFLSFKKNKRGTSISRVKLLPVRMLNQASLKVRLEILNPSLSTWSNKLAKKEEASNYLSRGLGRRELNNIFKMFPRENIIFNQESLMKNDCL